MKPKDLFELLVLAAIWGASFLFMRLSVHAFGPVAMATLRVAGASLFLMPILWRRQGLQALKRDWRPLAVVGLLNSALPFALFAYAALSITAGMSSILNATTPLWGALVAWLWLSQGLSASRIVGMVLAFSGVVFLAWDHASFKPGGSGWAIVACLAAALCYGIAGNYSRRHLNHASPLSVATGSQVAAALMLGMPAGVNWPDVPPPALAWFCAAMLALLCSGVAYLLYFRLIQRIGPSNAMAVTFLIPVFAHLWGFLFLAESLDLHALAGCIIVLAGTALAVGLVTPRLLFRTAS